MIGKEKALRRVCDRLEEVENYGRAKFDKSQYWVLHHKNGCDLLAKRDELIENDMYLHCQPEELKFVPITEHMREHAAAKNSNKFETELEFIVLEKIDTHERILLRSPKDVRTVLKISVYLQSRIYKELEKYGTTHYGNYLITTTKFSNCKAGFRK